MQTLAVDFVVFANGLQTYYFHMCVCSGKSVYVCVHVIMFNCDYICVLKTFHIPSWTRTITSMSSLCCSLFRRWIIQYIPRNMHTVFALLCFVVVIHWLIFPYPSGLLHWHCGNLTIAPVPAKQPWWIWINTSCEFIMNDCITTTKQSTTKSCAYFLGYTVYCVPHRIYWHRDLKDSWL